LPPPVGPHVGPQRIWMRRWSRFGCRGGGVDLGSDRRDDRGELLLADPEPQQSLVVHRERVVVQPRSELFGRPVGAGISTAVAAVAVGPRLDQRRSTTRPGAVDGGSGG